MFDEYLLSPERRSNVIQMLQKQVNPGTFKLSSQVGDNYEKFKKLKVGSMNKS
jgi:hypothetical protein